MADGAGGEWETCVECAKPIGLEPALHVEGAAVHWDCILPLKGEAGGTMRFVEGPEP